MQPLNFAMPQVQFTKVSKFICISTLIVSFFSMLPNFRHFVVLIPASFFLTIPRFWVLLSSIFQEPSFFSMLFSCLFIIMITNFVEPILGSREFLRIYLLCGFFTNIFVIFFAVLMFLITKEKIILFRSFATSGSSFMGIIVSFIYVTFSMTSLKVCGCIKLRYFAFYKIMADAFISLLTMRCDSLLSSLFGFIISFSYFRFIRRKRNQNGTISPGTRRGDPQFTIESLIPFWDPNRADGNDDNGNNQNWFSQQDQNNTSSNNSLFSGTPHRLDGNP